MADKLSILKLKNVMTYSSNSEDEKDDDYDDGTAGEVDDQLDLPSFDKLVLGPKKKLLILCLGGLLVHRVHLKNKSTVLGFRPDIQYLKFLVFKRPFCTEFMKFCFERFDVALWSAAREYNIDGLLRNITGGMERKLLFVWNQEDCIDSGYKCLDNNKKPLFLKDLKKLWEKSGYKGKYSASNTLLIDDEPHTCIINPPNTAIFPQPYKVSRSEDTLLGPKGQLRKFLDGLVDAEDVPSYVEAHRIGQPPITELHPHWSSYARVIRSFNKTAK